MVHVRNHKQALKHWSDLVADAWQLRKGYLLRAQGAVRLSEPTMWKETRHGASSLFSSLSMWKETRYLSRARPQLLRPCGRATRSDASRYRYPGAARSSHPPACMPAALFGARM